MKNSKTPKTKKAKVAFRQSVKAKRKPKQFNGGAFAAAYKKHFGLTDKPVV